VASSIIGGVALGEVRGRKLQMLPTCTGTTLCWAAAVVAWAHVSIIVTLGCHRRRETLCMGA
jgi:hypothetical protein|tara:strand:+ start:206 stop:391 length:186 start_codon:yes stop_codon:yes gene_type:complete